MSFIGEKVPELDELLGLMKDDLGRVTAALTKIHDREDKRELEKERLG